MRDLILCLNHRTRNNERHAHAAFPCVKLVFGERARGGASKTRANGIKTALGP